MHIFKGNLSITIKEYETGIKGVKHSFMLHTQLSINCYFCNKNDTSQKRPVRIAIEI